MAYKRRMGWEPGKTLFACSICGCAYRFPGEMHYADDRQFYCYRTCWLGKTPLGDSRERAALSAGRKPDTLVPKLIGPKPHWES